MSDFAPELPQGLYGDSDIATANPIDAPFTADEIDVRYCTPPMPCVPHVHLAGSRVGCCCCCCHVLVPRTRCRLTFVSCVPAPFARSQRFDKLRARLSDMKGDSIADNLLDNDSVMWRYVRAARSPCSAAQCSHSPPHVGLALSVSSWRLSLIFWRPSPTHPPPRFYSANANGECACKVEEALAGAEKQFRAAVAWRREEDVDGMWERWRGGDCDLSQRDPTVQLGHLVFHGQGSIPPHARTPAGGPVMFERAGRIDVGGMTADGDDAAMLRKAFREAYIMSVETAWRANLACGRRARATLVLDLRGLGWGLYAAAKLTRLLGLAKIAPSYYPDLTDAMHIVRAPTLFKAMSTLVRLLVPQRVRNKVRAC
jgi:hypothetical protein